ncbi:MAG: hypothetical protein GF308_22085 [Candidatus Heimdallarchaeota archaeon]|nr:hypothetical protein [Candidatus Heimdallarchaeota archaeon]
MKLTSSHKEGLCDHFPHFEGGTIWSWIYNIGEPDILICQGPPCSNVYDILQTKF